MKVREELVNGISYKALSIKKSKEKVEPFSLNRLAEQEIKKGGVAHRGGLAVHEGRHHHSVSKAG